MTQVNYDVLARIIHDVLRSEVNIEYDPDTPSLKFGDGMTNFSIKLKDLKEAAMLTIEACRPFIIYEKLFQALANANNENPYGKIYYKEGHLYLSVSTLYPQGESIEGLIRWFLTKIWTDYNGIYDKLEHARLG